MKNITEYLINESNSVNKFAIVSINNNFKIITPKVLQAVDDIDFDHAIRNKIEDGGYDDFWGFYTSENEANAALDKFKKLS